MRKHSLVGNISRHGPEAAGGRQVGALNIRRAADRVSQTQRCVLFPALVFGVGKLVARGQAQATVAGVVETDEERLVAIGVNGETVRIEPVGFEHAAVTFVAVTVARDVGVLRTGIPFDGPVLIKVLGSSEPMSLSQFVTILQSFLIELSLRLIAKSRNVLL